MIVLTFTINKFSILILWVCKPFSFSFTLFWLLFIRTQNEAEVSTGVFDSRQSRFVMRQSFRVFFFLLSPVNNKMNNDGEKTLENLKWHAPIISETKYGCLDDGIAITLTHSSIFFLSFFEFERKENPLSNGSTTDKSKRWQREIAWGVFIFLFVGEWECLHLQQKRWKF